MPTKCCIKGCHSKWGRDKVKFHRFPRDPILKERWIKNLKLNIIPTHHRVCSVHFPPDSLNETGRVKEQYIPQVSFIHNYSTLMEHNYTNKKCPFQGISGKSSLENSRIKELGIETNVVQNENSSNQVINLKKKRRVRNEVVETPTVLKLKKKLKIVQQKLRRSNKKLAAVLKKKNQKMF